MHNFILEEGDKQCKAAETQIFGKDKAKTTTKGEKMEPSFERAVEDDMDWDDRVHHLPKGQYIVVVDRNGSQKRAFAGGYHKVIIDESETLAPTSVTRCGTMEMRRREEID